MRKLVLRGSTDALSAADMWRRISAIENYPRHVKYCKSVTAVNVASGGYYVDVTTILWLPLAIEHHIISIKEGEELHSFLPLPLRGKAWHTFKINQKDGCAEILAEATFDLGNPFFNNTVAWVLAYRTRTMFASVFPEITHYERRIS